MSASDGRQQGLVRPIPIHVYGRPSLDIFSLRLPVSANNPAGRTTHLWNPALDLRPQSKDITTNDKTPNKNTTFLEPSTLHLHQTPVPISTVLSSSSSTSTLPVSTNFRSLKRSSNSPEPPGKVASAANLFFYKHLERHFPPNLENPLNYLASKECLIPFILGVPGAVVGFPTFLPNAAQTPSPVLSSECCTILNDHALAQVKTLTERLELNRSETPRGQVVPHQHLNPHHHKSHHHPQQHARNPHLHPAPQQHPPTAQPSPRTSFQSALARTFVAHDSSHAITPVISQDNLAAHGYGRKFYLCPQCRYTTDRRNNLKRHMLTMHQTSSKMLECCGIFFSTKASLREHAMVFHYHGYTCYFCGRRFCRKALLKRHLSVHNGKKDFVCNICDYATSHKSNLERHRKIHSRQEDEGDGGSGHRYHDDGKSNGSEAVSHDDMSGDELSVCSDFDDDIDEEINVHSD